MIESKRVLVERVGLALTLSIGCVILWGAVNSHTPVKEWLLLRYGLYWLLTLVFCGALFLSGFALLRVVWNRPWTLLERVALSFPLGLLAYFFLAFLAGCLGLFGPVFFFGAPLVLGGAGFWASRGFLRRGWRHLKPLVRSGALRPGWGSAVLHVAGLFALALIYFSILSPMNVGYDARWYHLPLAEQYSDAGRIFRFGEGWVMGSYPQLSSLVYAWAFQVPGFVLFDRIELCAHLEFALLVVRLLAVPCLVRALVPARFRRGERAFFSWALLFLYPGIFLYDSALGIGADHIAALFAAPFLVVFFPFARSLSWRGAVLCAAFVSGVLLTKYTGLLVAVPAIALVVGLCVLRLVRPRGVPRITTLWSTGSFAIAGLLFTAPHWLKNWIWYGDPLYPQLHNRLALRPWTTAADIPYHFDIAVPWHATRDLAGLKEASRVTATFAFHHHDWPDLHGKLPVFGFLFSLTILSLPFIRGSKRLWTVFLAGHAGVFVWAMISWQDRYLQLLVPWMAAASAAVLIVAWKMHASTRAVAVFLALSQLAWGSDVYFFSTHRMIRSPIEASMALINSGRQKKYAERFDIFAGNRQIDEKLPPGAVPLVHESRQTLGIGRRRVSDRPGTQGKLYYERVESADELYRTWKELGISHVLYGDPERISPVGADLVFYDFVLNELSRAKKIGSYRVTPLTAPRHPRKYASSDVAVFECDKTYEPGLYRLDDLRVSPFDPKRPYPKPRVALGATDSAKLLERAQFVVLNGSCPSPEFPRVTPGFAHLTQRGATKLLARPPAAR